MGRTPWDIDKILKKTKNKKEKTVEEALKKGVEKLGGLCFKLVFFAAGGWPDRTVLMPRGRIYFVELKKPGKRVDPESRQGQVMQLLRNYGFLVWEANCEEEVQQILSLINARS